MAIGDMGAFTPAESHYQTPGAYDAVLSGEALKRAAYLSSMDQFYANLDESERQFDLTLEFKTETRDMELAFGREKLAYQKEIDYARLHSQESYQDRLLDLREREMDLQYDDDEPYRFRYDEVTPRQALDWLGEQQAGNREALGGGVGRASSKVPEGQVRTGADYAVKRGTSGPVNIYGFGGFMERYADELYSPSELLEMG